MHTQTETMMGDITIVNSSGEYESFGSGANAFLNSKTVSQIKKIKK